MPTIDYFLTGDHAEAQQRFTQALESQGFTMKPEQDGTFRAERGSAAMTALFGAFAGKSKQRIVFRASYFDNNGMLVARIQRDTGGGAMAGAIGVSRSNKAFEEVDQAIGQSMTDAGILANVVRG